MTSAAAGATGDIVTLPTLSSSFMVTSGLRQHLLDDDDIVILLIVSFGSIPSRLVVPIVAFHFEFGLGVVVGIDWRFVVLVKLVVVKTEFLIVVYVCRSILRFWSGSPILFQ